MAPVHCTGDPDHDGGRPLQHRGDDQGQPQGVGVVNNHTSQRGACNRGTQLNLRDISAQLLNHLYSQPAVITQKPAFTLFEYLPSHVTLSLFVEEY